MNFTHSLHFFLLLALIIAGCGNKNSSTGSMAAVDLVGGKQGQAVAFADVDGDGISDKLVGAPYSETAGGERGSVMVYKGSPSRGFGSAPSAVMTGDDNFGYSMAAVGDVDGDGTDDYAISAIHGSGPHVSLSGTVQVYRGGTTDRILGTLSGEWPLDKFGVSIASGDLNNDGIPDLVVGAPFNTNNPALYQSGAVYVYLSADSRQAFADPVPLYASSRSKGLGWAVAAGDVNGDGTDDLVMAATGAVLAFYGSPSFSPSVTAPDAVITGTAAGFGKSLAIVPDVNGAPGAEIAIGAPNAVLTLAGVSSRDVGSVFIVSTASGTNIDTSASTPQGSLVARLDGETLFSRFGASVQAAGTYLAAGAPLADAGWDVLSGKVYLFKREDLAGNPWAGSSVFTGMVKNQGYGTSLAFASTTLLIGAPRSNMDTGGADMVDPATGQTVPGGSSGGSSGGSGECH